MAQIVKKNIAHALNSLSGVLGTADQIKLYDNNESDSLIKKLEDDLGQALSTDFLPPMTSGGFTNLSAALGDSVATSLVGTMGLDKFSPTTPYWKYTFVNIGNYINSFNISVACTSTGAQLLYPALGIVVFTVNSGEYTYVGHNAITAPTISYGSTFKYTFLVNPYDINDFSNVVYLVYCFNSSSSSFNFSGNYKYYDNTQFILNPIMPKRDGSVTSENIANGAVTTAKIENDAVTTAKIANGAITQGKLASNSVTSAKLEDGAVTTDKITDGSITKAKLNSNVADNTTIKLSNNGLQIKDNGVDYRHLSDYLKNVIYPQNMANFDSWNNFFGNSLLDDLNLKYVFDDGDYYLDTKLNKVNGDAYLVIDFCQDTSGFSSITGFDEFIIVGTYLSIPLDETTGGPTSAVLQSMAYETPAEMSWSAFLTEVLSRTVTP